MVHLDLKDFPDQRDKQVPKVQLVPKVLMGHLVNPEIKDPKDLRVQRASLVHADLPDPWDPKVNEVHLVIQVRKVNPVLI